ncbi:MAG: ankyrin repeat protein [Alcaligenaceae bacterium]|nr:MAG: ankyrin repeat protein [Alcaligenaceae bacterium]
MSELQRVIEQAYEMAKSGQWDRLLSEWSESDVLANRCSRYMKPGSSWSFLHQAAYFGNEKACRVLIGRGASIEATTHDSRTPCDVAERTGHHGLAGFLRAASIGRDTLWSPPMDPDVLPSSNRWSEAREARAKTQLFVAYGGGLVRIPKGTPYFTDSLLRILVGWHGTFNPPCGMDGESMLSE